MRGGRFGLTAAATALIGVGYLVCVGFCLRWKKKHYLVDFIFMYAKYTLPTILRACAKIGTFYHKTMVLTMIPAPHTDHASDQA